MSWGNERIGCIRPENEVSTLVYATSNQVEIAFSLAEGQDPQYNTSEVYIYEAIEKSTIVFEVSFSTARETVPHVSNCQAYGPPTPEHPDGQPVDSQYQRLVPEADYGPGYLMLSIEDVLAAAGKNMADIGSEGAPLRLSGLEIIARVDVRNYHVPYRWPFLSWNPWQLPDASQIECTVRFDVLRDQFKVLLGFTAFGLAQTCLDYGWFYLHRQATTIAGRAFSRLDLQNGHGNSDFTDKGIERMVISSKKGD
eukprot:Skav219815  [mRNA]  locus=scaffold147:312806:314034:- [translate_table: standard]